MGSKVGWILAVILLLSLVSISSPGETRVSGNMVLVDGGEFLMGGNELPDDEEPVHEVTLNPFYMGKFEVTQAEWQAVMGNNPSLFKGDRLPVERVDWYEAIEYCNKKSKMEGLSPCYLGSGDSVTCHFDADGYRLPTEAEWEFACGGGVESGGASYSGSSNPGEVAWYEANSGFKTQTVGRKKSNELGVYDMSGNVKEWCWDRYGEDYYNTGPADNPPGPAAGKRRAYRGGSALETEMLLRLTRRFSSPPGYKNFDLGLRLVKKASGKLPPGMVPVEGGTFKMGSSKGTYGEKVVHRVKLNSFYIGKFEVLQEEWKAVMGKNPAYRKGKGCPIHFIDWYEAVAYCNRRSQKEGLTPCYSGSGAHITCNFQANGYRLPTEAEWEYACRGGLQSRHYQYSGSDDPDQVAWYLGNIVIFFQPAGQKRPNELGIFDMSGNVWEWCWDWYDFDYYRDSPGINPRGPRSGSRRVVRGGCFAYPEDSLQCASRFMLEPNRMGINIGFRVVRNAK